MMMRSLWPNQIDKSMNLEQIISSLDVISVSGDLDSEVTSISSDSREIATGGVFVAVSGNDLDGQQFVPQAILNGASAIISEAAKPAGSEDQVCWVHVADARAAAAALACTWYDHPSAAMKVVGITGTNGKSTVVHLVDEALRGFVEALAQK